MPVRLGTPTSKRSVVASLLLVLAASAPQAKAETFASWCASLPQMTKPTRSAALEVLRKVNVWLWEEEFGTAAMPEKLAKACVDAEAPVAALKELKVELSAKAPVSIRAVPPIAGLKRLDVFCYAAATQVVDLQHLSSFPSLEELTVAGFHLFEAWHESNTNKCGLADLGAMATLKSLRTLRLAHNVITSVEPLRLLDGLRKLDLSMNRITDVTPLSALVGLERLLLTGNDLASVVPLMGLVNVQDLEIGHNPRISDISPFSYMVNLRRLAFPKASVADVAPVGRLPWLQSLDFSENRVVSLAPLAALALRDLRFAHNAVVDVSPSRR